MNTERVLRDINEIRAGYDLEPITEIPKGTRHHARCCPLACALGGPELPVLVFVAEYYVGDDSFGLPPSLHEFRRAFDRGALPEYIA